MNGEYTLVTDKGKEIPLKLSKRALYNFEKSRDRSLLSYCLIQKGEDAEINIDGILRTDIAVDLAFYCQTSKKPYSKDAILNMVEFENLQGFLMQVIQEILTDYTERESDEPEKSDEESTETQKKK